MDTQLLAKTAYPGKFWFSRYRRSPPQARTTFFAKIRIADMTENVGKRRKLSENVGKCRKMSEIVGKRRKLSEIVGRCRKMLVSSQHCVEECNIYLT